MSALGQKQTYASQQAMSAIPPIATLNRSKLRRDGPQNCYALAKRDCPRGQTVQPLAFNPPPETFAHRLPTYTGVLNVARSSVSLVE